MKNTVFAVGGLACWLLALAHPAKADFLGRSLFFPAKLTVVPFDAGRKGAVATTDYHASRDASFWFYLDLKYDPNVPGARERILELEDRGPFRGGVRRVAGIQIPLHLTIFRKDRATETLVLDKTFEEERLDGWSKGSDSERITSVELKQGDYRVEIEALSDSAELNGIPVDFDIHIPGNMK